MVNERITENLIRNSFISLGYYERNDLTIEEQSSTYPRIDKLLKNASKKGSGQGYPEFIVASKTLNDFVCVVECKADTSKHISDTLDRYADYAVDGAKLYSSYLSKEYDVLFIGASGQNEKEFKASHYLQLKGEKDIQPIVGDKILSFDSYVEAYKDVRFRHDYSNLIAYMGKLNKALHTHKIPEDKRAILFSGILIALEDTAFQNSYTSYNDPIRLGKFLVESIIAKLQGANINTGRVHDMEQSFGFIKSHTALVDGGYLIELIKDVHNEVVTFVKSNQYFDILSRAYEEFLKYANNDKSLGIVLTPSHITDLFCELANVDKDSVVYDNCCGTGGFLVSAMAKMVKQAKGDIDKINHIKEKQLIGVEYQDHIYTLCCSNMIVHGDGKTNIIKASCFDAVDKVKEYKPTAGLLNPPYKSDKADIEELEFILNNCESLEKNSLCVAIVPMSCVLAQKGEPLKLKERLLKEHTLEAVLSMPDDLFYPVGVVTAIIIIKAHQPHPEGYKSYFGYWKDDGFIKRKHKGRVDDKNRWQDIKQQWLLSYRNRESVAGLSVTKEVKADDEWCAEAYMETDYSTLTESDFIKTIKDYVAFQFLHDDRL